MDIFIYLIYNTCVIKIKFKKEGNAMKKKIILIFGLLLIFVMSCGGKHPAVKDFESTMKIYQSGDFTKMSQNSENATINPEVMKTFGEAYKKITYKINKTTVNKDEAIINVTMKAPDLSGVMKEAIVKIMQDPKLQAEGSDKIMTDLIKEKLNDANNLKYNEKTFDIVYKKAQDKWFPDPYSNKEYFQMITFGILNTQ